MPKCPTCRDSDNIITTSQKYYCTACGWAIARVYDAPADPQNENECEACQ